MRADEIYREWLRNLKDDVREFGLWQAESFEHYGDLDYHFNQYLTDLAATFDDEGNRNPYKWLQKGEEAIAKIKEKLSRKFDILEEKEDETGLHRTGSLGGYALIDPNNPPPGATRRKKLFLSLASIVDYIKDVPYPAGIQEVRSNGQVVGYYLWVEK